MGSFSYPVVIYSETFNETRSIINIIDEAIVLQILAIMFLVLAVYLVVIVTKNPLSTMFISIVVLIGLILITGKIAPMGRILHLLPTTFLWGQVCYQSIRL